MKKIIYVVDQLKLAGGISRIVAMKANWWAQKGYDVQILTTEGTDLDSFYQLHPSVKVIPLNINFLLVYSLRKSIVGFLRIPFLRISQILLFRKRLKQIVLKYQPDVIFTTINSSAVTSLKDGSQKVFELHFSRQAKKEFKNTLPLVFRCIYSIYEYFTLLHYKKYDKVVLLTERDKNENWSFLKNSMVIPNFIPLSVAKNHLKQNSRRIIVVGRLCHIKGFDYLFQVWHEVSKIHPDWRLDIYGHQYDNQYKDICKKMGLRQIFIHNPTINIQDEYLSSEFCVMTSRSEGFPLVLCEAMSCGLPCIAFDCYCGPSEIITDGEDGLLVKKVGDISGMVSAICWMIEHPEEREKMSKNAIKNIQRFNIDLIMERWQKMF